MNSNPHGSFEEHDGNATRSHLVGLDQVISATLAREKCHQNIVEAHVKHHLPDRDLLVAGQDDHRFIQHCDQLVKLHAAITHDDSAPCSHLKATLRPGSPLLPAIKLNRLGKLVVECCQFYASNDHWGAAWSNHVFHPIVTVLLRAMKRYAVRIAQHHVSSSDLSHDLELGELAYRLVRFVRRTACSWRFINAVQAHTAPENSNFRSARDFIYYLVGKHSRLCILRIDLTFRTSAKDFSHTQAANKAVENYLRSLRSKACKRNLLPGYLGFIIKRENGISRGTHFHLMVILNGNLQGKTAENVDYISDKLGEMWLQRVGRDRGSFHDSYKDRAKWVFNGLGLLDFNRPESLIGLRIALDYITKQDCVLKTSNDKIKNFWRTPSPKGRGKKRGPKRKRPDHLALLYRMLGGPRSPYPPGFDPTPYVLAHKRRQGTLKPRYGAWDNVPAASDRLPE